MTNSLTFTEDNLGILLNPFGGFEFERVKLLSAFVDKSGLVDHLAKWRAEDKALTGPGGRPAVLNDRAVLVLLQGMALLSKPMHVTLMAEAVTRSMTPEARKFLGLPEKQGTYIQWYGRIWRALHSTLDVINPEPLHGISRTRLTPEQAAEVVANRDPEDVAKKQERLDFLANTLLETTWLCVPREIRRKHQGNTSVDGTAVKAFGQRGHSKDGCFMGMELDAAWHMRLGDHKDDGTKSLKGKMFGNEAHFVVTMANDSDFEQEFPLVPIGIAFDKPGFNIAENTLKIYESLSRRGHKPGLIVGDLAYAAGQAVEKFHGPLLELGHEFVSDYKVTQLGNVLQHEGAILVEGAWYCPCMEKSLVNATVDLFAKKIDGDTWKRRIKARERYLAVAKGKPDADGYYRLTHPTVAGKSVCNPNRKHTPKFCLQKSTTFPPSVGMKSRQPIRFGTDKWLSTYGHGRNAVETFNAYVKDDAKEALGAQSRRRIRSYGAQYLLSVVLVAAASMRKIRAFLEKKRKQDAATPGRTRAKRREPSLKYFRRFKAVAGADPDENFDKEVDPDSDPLLSMLE